MKKMYMKPLMEVQMVQLAQMIAASIEIGDDFMDPEDAESRGFDSSIWSF